MGDEGLERGDANALPHKGLRQIGFRRDAKSDAFSTKHGGADESLANVIERWPYLSDAIRQRVLALVNES
jgi:hypothetical protein